MQVFGLPGHIIRDALARWRKAMAQRLTGEQAAKAVGVPRATLYRWRARAEPLSRRPRRMRQPKRPHELAAAVERLRLDHPMWGKEKLGPILRGQGWATSNATVGRIIGDLIRRGRVQSVPALIRKRAARGAAKKRPHAIRKPGDVTFEKPGDVVQIDTLSIHPRPGVTIKQFNAYDPCAKWTVARPCKQATASNAAAFLDQVLHEMPDPVKAIQIDGGSEFMAEFEQACAESNLPLYVLPPDRPNSTAPSSAATAHGDTSSTPASISPRASTKSSKWPTLSSPSTTTTDRTEPLQEKPSAEYLSSRRADDTPESHMS